MNVLDLINLINCDTKDDEGKRLILNALNGMKTADVIRVAIDAKDPLVARIADIWLTRMGGRIYDGY